MSGCAHCPLVLLVESVLIVSLNSLEFWDGSSLWMCDNSPVLSHGLREDTAGGTGRAKGTLIRGFLLLSLWYARVCVCN